MEAPRGRSHVRGTQDLLSWAGEPSRPPLPGNRVTECRAGQGPRVEATGVRITPPRYEAKPSRFTDEEGLGEGGHGQGLGRRSQALPSTPHPH